MKSIVLLILFLILSAVTLFAQEHTVHEESFTDSTIVLFSIEYERDPGYHTREIYFRTKDKHRSAKKFTLDRNGLLLIDTSLIEVFDQENIYWVRNRYTNEKLQLCYDDFLNVESILRRSFVNICKGIEKNHSDSSMQNLTITWDKWLQSRDFTDLNQLYGGLVAEKKSPYQYSMN